MRRLHVGIDRLVGLGVWAQQQRLPSAEDTQNCMEFYTRQSGERLFPAPRRPRLHVHGRRRVGGFEYRALSMQSEHRPLHPHMTRRYRWQQRALHRCRVRHVRTARRRRAVVFLHAWMVPAPLSEDLFFAPLLCRTLDAEVYCLQQPHHGQRQLDDSPYHGAHFASADTAMTVESFRQSVLDARSVVQHLWQTGDYDEVGVCGVSLGGAVSLMLACVEPRLNFVIPVVAHIDIGDVIENAPITRALRVQLARIGVSAAQVAEWNRRIVTDRLTPAVEPERMLFMPARHDVYMRAGQIQELSERWGGAPLHWLRGGHITAMAELPGAMRQARAHVDALPRLESGPRQTTPPDKAA